MRKEYRNQLPRTNIYFEISIPTVMKSYIIKALYGSENSSYPSDSSITPLKLQNVQSAWKIGCFLFSFPWKVKIW